MSLLIAENISQSFGAQEVLKNISFRVADSDRTGVVGPNGGGKTTLLRIAAGLLESTRGAVHRKRGLSIGYLPQTPPAPGESTIHDAMLDVFADLRLMEKQLHELAARMNENADDELVGRYGTMQADFERLGGYDYNTRIQQVLSGLGFERSTWAQPLSQLSGGQLTRAYLAALLLKEPDVLMLDEPTNHLDLNSVEWLEYWLRSFRGAVLVVSHDRYLLDNVCSQIWEISPGCFETFRGNYSAYQVQREERLKDRMNKWEAQQDYIAKTREFIARHITGQRTREAQGRRKRLERFLRDEAIEKPAHLGAISLSIDPEKRTGDIVFRGENLNVGYHPSEPLVKIETLEVLRGERIAIVGANGTGKTTLLRTILGEIEPLSGVVRHGSNVNIGYLSQSHCELDPEQNAIESVLSTGAVYSSEKARSILGSMLISGDEAYKKTSELSGGQKTRVVLARLVVVKPNVLVLDEPTNHLDIPSTEIIQDILRRFEGTILFVSHDRFLVQAIATHIWVVDGEQMQKKAGGWEDYLEWRNRAAASDNESTGENEGADVKHCRRTEFKESRKQANLMQKLRRRHEEIERKIETTEKKLATLNEEITVAGQGGDLAGVDKLGNEYRSNDEHLKRLWEEWEQVGEKLE